MAGVTVLKVSRVTPKTLRDHRITTPLSLLDNLWVSLPPVQQLFFYDRPANAATCFPSIVSSLKTSLSTALNNFPPLSGTLVYQPSTGDVAIDLANASSDGVNFTEAECDCKVPRPADGSAHNIELFLQLVPKLGEGVLPSPTLAVQATRFKCGGVAVGFTAQHAIADGRSYWKFIEAWSRACCKGTNAVVEPAMYDRAAICYPRSQEIARQFLRQLSPALPSTALPIPSIQGRYQLERRTFTVSSATVQRLKSLTSTEVRGDRPSTFAAVSAYLWLSILRSRDLKPHDNTALCFLVDCRILLNPPINDNYFGNCVVGCQAVSRWSEISGVGGYARAYTIIKNAIRERQRGPLNGCEEWPNKMIQPPAGSMVNIVASPGFKVYDMADYGFGKPIGIELVSMNHDGEIVMVGSRDGGVQVSVALSSLHMEKFAGIFHSGLHA